MVYILIFILGLVIGFLIALFLTAEDDPTE